MASTFEESVWHALTLIPLGRVTTYGAIAACLNTRAVRAVGTAVGKNPNAPEVPCHRVVRADGAIGQYSGGEGVATKIALLEAEGIVIREGRVVDFDRVLWRYAQSVTSPSGS